MRKPKAIATAIVVGVLSLLPFSHQAFAETVDFSDPGILLPYSAPDGNTYTDYFIENDSSTGGNWLLTLFTSATTYRNCGGSGGPTSGSFGTGDLYAISGYAGWNSVCGGTNDGSYHSNSGRQFQGTSLSALSLAGTPGLAQDYVSNPPVYRISSSRNIYYGSTLLVSATPLSPVDTTTRIISLDPADGTTTPSGVPVSFNFHGYINPDDMGSINQVYITLQNIDLNHLGLTSNDINFVGTFATSSGDYYFASSTVLSDGNYRITASFDNAIAIPFTSFVAINPFGVHASLSHQFVVGSSTFLGQLQANTFEAINGNYASSTATSSNASCNPISSAFSVNDCLGYLFIPSQKNISDAFSNFKTNVAYHFPLGYVTDFIAILATTSTSSIPVVDATVPAGIIGSGAHIRLDLSHSLDYVLNSTSTFSSGSATSTETLFEITSRYWDIIVYIGLAFYLVSRILGSRVIPLRHLDDDKSK